MTPATSVGVGGLDVSRSGGRTEDELVVAMAGAISSVTAAGGCRFMPGVHAQPFYRP